MDDQNNKNLLLATGLSMLVILIWLVFFPPPEPVVDPNRAVVETADDTATTQTGTADGAATETATTAPRIVIDTPLLSGTIATEGGRIDDLNLKAHNETLEDGAGTVRLLSPVGQDNPYYASFGWTNKIGLEPTDVPDQRTEWSFPADAKLTVKSPVTLTWSNGKGLEFKRTIAVDDHYMFTITDAVENDSAQEVSLSPFASISRIGVPTDLENIFVVHEGAISRSDGRLCENDYTGSPWLGCDSFEEMEPNPEEGGPTTSLEVTTDGWTGFTDHYWMTTLIPKQGSPFTSVTRYIESESVFRASVRYPEMSLSPGKTIQSTTRLFAGAKEWETIRAYQNEGSVNGVDPDAEPIPGFIDSIDWGLFYFLTKPIFAVLHWLNAQIGNMGFAIIGLTFFLKLLVLPLAYKSYVSMARMKELQPEMEALKERVGDDKQRMQKEMMQLYKDRKVNPAAGCLPVLIQIPIFFALYKVIFVTIELRHAPFFGWLNDLSAPDSSSTFNLFGLLPWDAPAQGSLLALIFIGILPILLGITMWLQQKLNPAPADPVQQQIFAWMPWVFMFMLGGFASGLVIYWITNNTITFVQQYAIMRSHGHKPDLFGNIKSGLKRKPAAETATPPAKPAPVKPAPSKPAAPKVTTSAPANRATPPRNRKPRK
jgi:YidC/Oxa1 family membrane protein insertase